MNAPVKQCMGMLVAQPHRSHSLLRWIHAVQESPEVRSESIARGVTIDQVTSQCTSDVTGGGIGTSSYVVRDLNANLPLMWTGTLEMQSRIAKVTRWRRTESFSTERPPC